MKNATMFTSPLKPRGLIRKKVFALFAASVAALCLAAALACRAQSPRLDIKDKSGVLVGSLELPDGCFEHVFVHSFHLTPVRECFRVERSSGKTLMRLYELRYRSMGVGMPVEREKGLRLDGDDYVLAMDRLFTRIPLIVSIVQGHGLVAGGVFHPFTEWAAAEDYLVLEARMAN